MLSSKVEFPAEWSEQSAVLIAMPHADTDWAYMLEEVQQCFRDIAAAIASREHLVVVAPDVSKARAILGGGDNIRYYQMPTNDTWARDFGGITVVRDGKPVVLDFKFNAWGLKFAANYDNLINRNLYEQGAFCVAMENRLNFVLEGGSVESDGNGTLMTTSECLLSPNRNGQMTQSEIESYLKSAFGVENVLWLDYGYLEGDDTDSHIDTLARFAPGNQILYVRCDDKDDAHYEALSKMERQLRGFRNANCEPYKLVALPMPKAIYDEDNLRLPATYANFLIANGQVLVPIYNDDADERALDIIRGAFPGYDVVGIDCRALIRQHGSLHCVTMQFPKNVINLPNK